MPRFVNVVSVIANLYPEKNKAALWHTITDQCAFIRKWHDDVIKWKHFPRNWPFVRGIHRSPVNSPHKGQWRGALMISMICVWINDWVNNREAGDLRRYRAHHDVIVMKIQTLNTYFYMCYQQHIITDLLNDLVPYHTRASRRCVATAWNPNPVLSLYWEFL